VKSAYLDGELCALILLADVAVSIELPPSQHDIATQRFEITRKWIERPERPLVDHILRFYPQGSMAINATISPAPSRV
jgi:hypothetical protein